VPKRTRHGRESLCVFEVLPRQQWRLPPLRPALPSPHSSTNSCARPMPSGTLCFRSKYQSLQVVVNPCCAEALPDVISTDLSPRVRTSIPAAPRVHAPVSSPKALAFPETETGRRIAKAQRPFLLGVRFRNCSHSLLFSPAELLASPIAPTLTSCDVGQPRLLQPRRTRLVTCPVQWSC
jgi:hypothetical protein